MINSLFVATFLLSLLLSSATQARKFYNTEGKSIEAELISVENGTAVMKMDKGREVKIPITKLSTADQNYIKRWWKENKNRISERDVKVSIRQKSIYTKRPETKIIGKGKSKVKTSQTEVTFFCKVDNYAAKTINGIKASYSVHKRVSKRGKKGSSTEVEIVTNTMLLKPLESHKEVKFTTDGVKCSNMSDSKTDVSVRETIIGMVLTLSVDGNKILTQSHPENLIKRIEEEEARQERKSTTNGKREEQKEIADGKREEKKEIADGKREDSQDAVLSRKDREAAVREKRKREEKEAREKRRREELEKRN